MDYFSNRENSEKIKKNILLSALNDHFENSTLQNNRIITSDGKYDIIARNNLDIIVVKHGGDYLKDGEIELSYYYDETDTDGDVIVEIYPEIGGVKTYEQYAEEVINSLSTDETKRTKELEQIFIEAEKYLEYTSPEGLDCTDFVEYMQNDYSGYGFADGEVPTTLDGLRIWVNNNWGGTFKTVEEMLICRREV